MSSLFITVKSDRTDLDDIFSASTFEGLQELTNFFAAVGGGCENAVVDVQIDESNSPVAASGTITLASVGADETVTIGNVTFTAKASPSGETQFSQAGDDTADAAALAAKINAHSTLKYQVAATSALGVVTVTCLQEGVVGNLIPLSKSGAGITVSGSGFLASGTGNLSTASTFSNGL